MGDHWVLERTVPSCGREAGLSPRPLHYGGGRWGGGLDGVRPLTDVAQSCSWMRRRASDLTKVHALGAQLYSARSPQIASVLAVTQVRIEVSETGPVVVQLAGEFDLSTCEEMARCFDAFASGDVVVVDMAEVTFVDSIAIGVLARAAARGVRLQPRAMSRVVSRALELAGLLAIFDAAELDD